MTRSSFIPVAFWCVLLFAVGFVLAGALDAPWLRLASLAFLLVGAIAFQTWQWWGDWIWIAILVGLSAVMVGAAVLKLLG